MPFLTSESVVLVTASSAGLGAATARAFASRGVNVVVNYLSNRAKAENLVQELATLDPRPQKSSHSDASGVDAATLTKPRFIAIHADVSQRLEIIRLVGQTLEQMGRLDAVISNQGWTRMRNFFSLDENVEEEDWDKCFNVNVKSHLFLFHAAREHLDKSRGAFVSVASLAGVKPSGSSVVCGYLSYLMYDI
jgi:NAD(P)-dependent dehydrogenase (short-subunit alcohol dehydrogenase family)